MLFTMEIFQLVINTNLIVMYKSKELVEITPYKQKRYFDIPSVTFIYENI